MNGIEKALDNLDKVSAGGGAIAGAALGAAGAAKVGALIGTTVGPLGTLAGAAVGAVIGGVGGYCFGWLAKKTVKSDAYIGGTEKKLTEAEKLLRE